MSAEKELLKQLKIKTGACVRLVKDTVQSTKEIASQNERIERVRADPEKDDHDVRKQQEVLQEYVDGQKDEFNRLKKAWEALTEQIVRRRPLIPPLHAIACFCSRPCIPPLTRLFSHCFCVCLSLHRREYARRSRRASR